mgnify:FL=1
MRRVAAPYKDIEKQNSRINAGESVPQIPICQYLIRLRFIQERSRQYNACRDLSFAFPFGLFAEQLFEEVYYRSERSGDDLEQRLEESILFLNRDLAFRFHSVGQFGGYYRFALGYRGDCSVFVNSRYRRVGRSPCDGTVPRVVGLHRRGDRE